MYYKYHKETKAKDQTLVLIHGFLGTHHDFTPLITQLKATHTILSIDLPGHGQSIGLDDTCYSYNNTAEKISQILNQENIQNATLLGYSMGGRIALQVALKVAQRNPKRIKKLILESTHFGLTETEKEARREWENQIIQNIKENSLSEFLDQWYSQPLFGDIKEHHSYPNLLKNRLKQNKNELIKAFQGLSICNQPNFYPELVNFPCPIHYIVGEKDRKYKEIALKIKKEDHPQIQCDIIPNVSHNTHIENTTRFRSTLQEIIKN